MARIRTIKPEIWMSPQVMNLDYGARLLFIGLITQADDDGRGTADPRRLKAAIFGGDDETSSNVRRMLDDIATHGLVALYEAPEHGLLYQLTSWRSHQKIDRPRKSAYPSPDSPSVRRVIDETSSNIRRGSDRTGPDQTEREGNGPARAPEADATAGAVTGNSREPSNPSDTHRAHAHEMPQLSAEFEPFMISTCPETSHRRDFVTAIHSAQGIVGSGKATEEDLRRRWAGFRKFVDAGGYSDTSKVPTPQRWFQVHQQGEAYWQREWEAPKAIATGSKAAEDPEAADAWDRLIASAGADRSPRAHQALQRIGGWPRVAERTTHESKFIRREFIDAYVAAKQAAA